MKIGEFAKQHNVSTKMLRHYDELGLFSPMAVDFENGYRLYHPTQSHKLKWILLLKDLDFSLADIKDLLNGPISSDILMEALVKKRLDIAVQFRSSLQKSLQIEGLLALITQEGFDMERTIDLTTLTIDGLLDIKKSMPTLDMLIEKSQELAKRALEHTTYGLVRIDLKQFMAINERDGYEVGDRVLITLYRILEDALLLLKLNGATARAGGDEFVILLEGKEDDIKALIYHIKSSVHAVDHHAIGCHKPMGIHIGAVMTKGLSPHQIHAMLEVSEKDLKSNINSTHPGELLYISVD